MFSFLLSVVALTLLPLAAASSSSSVDGGDSPQSHSYDLSGSALSTLLNAPVYAAERMKRPLEGTSRCFGPICHSGVQVTLGDGTKWLVHKGDGFGISSQTVVTDARHMSSSWEPVSHRDYDGTKRVTDFVRAGGAGYNVLLDNCHLGSRRMMDQ